MLVIGAREKIETNISLLSKKNSIVLINFQDSESQNLKTIKLYDWPKL